MRLLLIIGLLAALSAWAYAVDFPYPKDRLPSNGTNVQIGTATNLNWTFIHDIESGNNNVSLYGMHEDDINTRSCFGSPHLCNGHAGDSLGCIAAGCTWTGSACKGTHDPCSAYDGNAPACMVTHACDFYADPWTAHALLKFDENVVNNSYQDYNWSHSPGVCEANTILNYHFDNINGYETSTTAIDWCGNETSVNVTGGIYLDLYHPMGKWAGPGANDFVIDESPEVKNTGFPKNTTIKGWFLFDSLGTTETLFERSDLAGSDGFKLKKFSDDTIGITDDNDNVLLNTSTALSETLLFYHLAWTCLAKNLTHCNASIYINGTKDASGLISPTSLVDASDFTLTKANGPVIDDFQYMNKWSNDSEINNSYRSRYGLNRWKVNITNSNGWNNFTVPIWHINVTNLPIVTDSCTYSSGDWEIDCSDNCQFTANVDLGGNNIYLTNAGNLSLEANLTDVNYLVFPQEQCYVISNGGNIIYQFD